ncbi:MAG: hypothetical protein K8R21_14080, partial [Leptospira sp.]|nr:hypothetical protein [Leptospira sp.]
MFLSKLSLLAAKAGQPELEHTIDRQTVRENLYEFLKDDLVYFLQKALSGRQLCDGFPDLSPLQKEIIQILKELGVYVYYPVGKDFNRTSIMERWYLSLFKTGKILTLPKVINYFNIYRNRLYSLAETMPFEFSDVRRLTRKMLTSNDYEISFEEIYNSELAL